MIMKCCFDDCYNDCGIYGHNAEPAASGRCCGDCNGTVVVPFRIHLLLTDKIGDKNESR
tara:strand:+ start:138 stop:314 length:177 start_codon:yes stop_codon:yes gene_type:complete